MYILLTKVTAAQIEVAISHYKVRGLYFKAVIFAASIVYTIQYTAYSIENTLSSSTSHIEFNPGDTIAVRADGIPSPVLMTVASGRMGY